MKTRNLFTVLLMFATATAFAETVDLTGQTEPITATDGQTLTGALATTVSIADGATVTFSGIQTAEGQTGHFVCEGDATVVLVGENHIYPGEASGIQIGPKNTTFTIKGNGTLNITLDNDYFPGIGIGGRLVNNYYQGGNIVIESGIININTPLYSSAAGIGNGYSEMPELYNFVEFEMGNIFIKGGTINARVGRGGGMGRNIVESVSIYDGITLIDGDIQGNKIQYYHANTALEDDNVADYFTIIVENNSISAIYPKDETQYNVAVAEGIEGGEITYQNKTSAKYLETVEFGVSINSGYELTSVTVKDAENNDIAATYYNNRYRFRQPKSNVTINATFVQKPVVLNGNTLTINKGFTAADVKAYSGNNQVGNVQCSDGVVFPADCSDLFANFTNVSNIYLYNADVSAVRNTERMFQNCSNLSRIMVDYDSWDMSAVTQSANMFDGCTNLIGMLGTSYNGNEDADAATAKYAVVDGKNNHPGYLRFLFNGSGGSDEASALIIDNENCKYIAAYSTTIETLYGWYKITEDVTIEGTIGFSRDAHLIICDGATMQISKVLLNASYYIGECSLTIHGETNQTGSFIADNMKSGIAGYNGNFNISGGRIGVGTFDTSYPVNFAIADGLTYYYLDNYGNRTEFSGNISMPYLYNGKLLLPLITFPVSASEATPHYTFSAEEAVPDETVYIRAEENYIFGSISVTDTEGNSVEVTKDSDTQAYFTMPAGGATVTSPMRKSLSHSDISVAIQPKTYTGSALLPAVAVIDGQTALAEGVDFTVNLDDGPCVNVGTYSITITGTGNYYEEIGSFEFAIQPKAVTSANLTLESDVYNGEAQKPVVKDSTATLSEYSDYTLTLPAGGCTNAGEYTVAVNGTGNYTGSVEKSFTIGAKEIALNWSATALTYNGKAQAPSATAVGLAGSDECTVTVTGEATKVGKHTATATALSNANYKLPETVSTEFTIGKAAEAPNKPSSITTHYINTQLVALPTDWAWPEYQSLVMGNNTVTAVYRGADAGSYEVESVDVNVVREACLHNEGSALLYTLEPTCTHKGYTGNQSCKLCGEIYEMGDSIAALGHIYDTLAIAATCTTAGYKQLTCSRCNDVTCIDTIPAPGHKTGTAVAENLKASTCTVAGSVDSVSYCTVCKAEISRKTVEIPASGHKPDGIAIENVVAATYVAAGSYDSVVYCSVCRAEISRVKVDVPQLVVPEIDAEVVISQLEYTIGDSLNLDGGKIIIATSDSTTAEVVITPEMVSGFNPDSIGVQHVTIAFEIDGAPYTRTFEVTVKEPEIVVAQSVKISTMPKKVTYKKGEQLDVAGGKLTVTYSNGTTQNVDLKADMVSGFNADNVGKQKLTVTLKVEEVTLTATFEITVEATDNTSINTAAASAVSIYAHHNTIVVENAEDDIYVYDAMGRLICRDAINRVRAEIHINATGIYIVKTGNAAKRVMIND